MFVNSLIFNRRIFYLVTGFALLLILIAGIGSFAARTQNKNPLQTTPAASIKEPEQTRQKIKSVRIDLSSMDKPDDTHAFIRGTIAKLRDVGADTVFLTPWADGKSNYQSQIADENAWGEEHFVESFITAAHAERIKVFAWFVVGKDTFDPERHPDWFAETVEGRKYYHNDEPGVFIPVASLANSNYVSYHRALLREASALNVDGWVISEPLVGWGDRYDASYADFSPAMTEIYKRQTRIDPKELFDENSPYYYSENPTLYKTWTNLRARIVTDFVRASIAEMRENSAKPIVITVFTEPKANGTLVPFSELKEWLGEDIPALASLRPNYIEIQDLFYDFTYTQKPEWASTMVSQFKTQLQRSGYVTPLMVSVQGYNGEQELTPQAFGTAVKTAMTTDIRGVSFYALHTLSESEWNALKEVWR